MLFVLAQRTCVSFAAALGFMKHKTEKLDLIERVIRKHSKQTDKHAGAERSFIIYISSICCKWFWRICEIKWCLCLHNITVLLYFTFPSQLRRENTCSSEMDKEKCRLLSLCHLCKIGNYFLEHLSLAFCQWREILVKKNAEAIA